MRPILLLVSVLAATSASAVEPELRPGQTLEARVDGDLDGDGMADTAWLAGKTRAGSSCT